MGTWVPDIKTGLTFFSIFWRPRRKDEKLYQSKQMFQIFALFLSALHDPEIVIT